MSSRTKSTIQRRRDVPRPIGPFSFLLLASMTALPPKDCYAAEIEVVMSDALDILVSLSQVQVTLRRLTADQLLEAIERGATTNSGQKATLYRLTADGKAALAHARDFYDRIGIVARGLRR